MKTCNGAAGSAKSLAVCLARRTRLYTGGKPFYNLCKPQKKVTFYKVALSEKMSLSLLHQTNVNIPTFDNFFYAFW